MSTARRERGEQAARKSEFIIDDISILKRKWQAALRPDTATPPFEEVILGSLGRLADHIGLIHIRDGEPTLLHAGRFLQTWLGQDPHGCPLTELPPECSASIVEAYTIASSLRQPHQTKVHCVRRGIVEPYHVLALPMSTRWGAPVVAIYVCATGDRYGLVDTIFESTDHGILTLSIIRDETGRPTDFHVVDLNKGAADLLGLPQDELRWRCFGQSQHALAAHDVFMRIKAVAAANIDDEFELARAGGLKHVKVGVKPLGDLLAVTLTDVTRMKQREQSFRLLFDNNPMPMWVFDPQTHDFLSVNDAAIRHYGYSRKAFLGMRVSDIWPADELAAHGRALESVSDVYQSQCWRHIRADGSEIDVVSYGRRIAFEGRDAFLVALVDVTESRRVEARVAHMAHHDALTGLPNRAMFYERLTADLQSERCDPDPLAVLCIDLDLFKTINDSYGHPTGDRLLQIVADRFRRHLRAGDLVARIGGDEFAMIVGSVADSRQVGAFALEIIQALSQPYLIDGTELVIGASIGIAMAPDNGLTAEDLVRNADMALYRAKTELRGTHCFFEAEMDRQAQQRSSLATDLRRAFTNGEFQVHYQPLIDIADSRVVAFEALLRWRHPERGLVSPAEFIPVAEDIGLIVGLGEWVLQHACREAATWPDGIRIAVNLSPVQFRSRGLVPAVTNALAASGLRPDRLELEVTESVLLAETESNMAMLHQLRGLGVRISMDDFGTGYSSLGYLRSFPFDKIKIDRSFIRDLASRPDCVAIVRAISGLGRSLNIDTAAEGVETLEQLECLRSEGCTEVQGFLFSPARPAEELAELLAMLNGKAVARAA